MTLKNIDNKRAIELIEKCVQSIGTEVPEEPNFNHTMWTHDNYMFWLYEDDMEYYRDFFNLVKDNGRIEDQFVRDVFSEKSIHKRIKNLIGEFACQMFKRGYQLDDLEDKNYREAWQNWKKSFKIPRNEYKVFSVLQNLIVEERRSIGGVEIIPLSEQSVTEIIDEFGGVMEGSDQQKQIEQLKDIIEGEFLQNKRGAIVSDNLEGVEKKNVKNVFRNQVMEVVNTLLFFGSFEFSRSQRAHIDLKDRLPKGKTPFLVYSQTGDMNYTVKDVGIFVPYQLNNKVVERFEDMGFGIVDSILRKEVESRVEIEQRIVNSLMWYGRGLVDKDDRSKFLKLWISIESVFGGGCQNRINKLLADEEEGQENLKSLVSEFKGLRDNLAHRGRSADFDSGDVDRLLFLAMQSILKFIQKFHEKGWREIDEFFYWADTR